MYIYPPQLYTQEREPNCVH